MPHARRHATTASAGHGSETETECVMECERVAICVGSERATWVEVVHENVSVACGLFVTCKNLARAGQH